MSRRPREFSLGLAAGAFPGGHRSRVTPVPIPNTEVKPATADGTAWETAWESRSLPGLFSRGPLLKDSGPFSFSPDPVAFLFRDVFRPLHDKSHRGQRGRT